MSINYKHVKTFCINSLESVCRQYGLSEQNSTVQVVKSLINMDNTSHIELLAIFFLLLNIDTNLKESMMRSDTEQQQRKIENFCMNLRKHIVTGYLSMDKSSTESFVTQCSEAWAVA